MLQLANSPVAERLFINWPLNEGWYVSVPDFEGFEGVFANGIYSGQATLDSIRAVLDSGAITGISNSFEQSSPVAQVELWAAKLSISGALLTALTPNVTSVFQAVDGIFQAPSIPLGLLGLAKQSLELSTWLAQNLLPERSTSFLEATHLYLSDFSSFFGTQNVSTTYFGRENVLLDDVPQTVIGALGIMGERGIPKAPIFVYKGTADEVSPVEDTDALVQMYCNAGVTIEYQRAINVMHTGSGEQGLAAGWQWLKNRMDGVEVKEDCNQTNIVV